VLITLQGAESPCSRRIGVIGALVLSFHPKPSGRAAAEGFSPTPPRAHWIGSEFLGCIGAWGVCIVKCTPLTIVLMHTPVDHFNDHPRQKNLNAHPFQKLSIHTPVDRFNAHPKKGCSVHTPRKNRYHMVGHKEKLESLAY